MSALVQKDISVTLDRVLIGGDLSQLSPDQKVSFYNRVCESLGLNPLTKPFEYISLNNKLTLYAKRDCTDQLRKIHGVSIKIVSREKVNDVFMVTAQASMPNGRVDESIGAVNIAGLKGDALANSLMKTETKAKRRVTLSICGLGILDETELETVPTAKVTTQVTSIDPSGVHAQNASDVCADEGPDLMPGSHSSDLGEYTVRLGKKLYGKKLKEIDPKEIRSYGAWLVNEIRKKEREPDSREADFIDNAKAYLAELEGDHGESV